MVGVPEGREGAGSVRRGARFGALLEDRGFMCRVALDRFDEVRDEVMSPLELDVDVRPGLLHTLAERDEPVVGRDEEEGDHPNDDKDDDDLHEPPLRDARLAEGPAKMFDQLRRAFTARTMCTVLMPASSSISAGLPEQGIFRTARCRMCR